MWQVYHAPKSTVDEIAVRYSCGSLDRPIQLLMGDDLRLMLTTEQASAIVDKLTVIVESLEAVKKDVCSVNEI